MKSGTIRFRKIFLNLSIIAVLASILLLIFVIPQVRAEVIRGGTPEIALKAFWINFMATLLSALILLFIGLKISPEKKFWRAIAVVPVLLLLMTGLACLDAAEAYGHHGDLLKTAATALNVCGTIQIVTGAVVFILLFPWIRFVTVVLIAFILSYQAAYPQNKVIFIDQRDEQDYETLRIVDYLGLSNNLRHFLK